MFAPVLPAQVFTADQLDHHDNGKVAWVMLTGGGAAAAELALYDNTTATGTKICPNIKAAIDTTVFVNFADNPIPFSRLSMDITGAGAEFMVGII